MTRRKRPNLEPLEGRALLSVPGLSYSLTTDQSVYQPGQPVEMTFQATNVSDRPIAVDDGPSIDGFTVTHDGTAVWRSNAGVNPMFILLDTLQPGQSLTLTATWDGIPTGDSAPVPGTYVITNQLSPDAASATLTIAGSSSTSAPPGSTHPADPPTAVSPSSPTDPSPMALSVRTNHPTYRVGHPVRVTVTLRDAGGRPVDLASTSGPGGITVLDGTTEVWHSARVASRKVTHGHAFRLTAVWNGRPAQAGAAVAPGVYTVEADEGGLSGSTTFRVTG
jgi:Intracellular proteinase inhibitor